MLAALAVTTIVVVAATLVILWRKHAEEFSARLTWRPPAQAFLPSMRVQPGPGWRTTATDLGLPALTPGDARPSRIATDEDAFESWPFVGNLGDDAYFRASSAGGPGREWWLAGINVRDGHRLFPAVPLPVSPGKPAPRCYLNGPDAVLCLTRDIDNVTAWVIDAQTGRVSYTGPTDLRTYSGKLAVHQIGIYAVAMTQFQGVYGIGPKAETTWFIPGDGDVDQLYAPPHDTETLTLASQTTPGRGSDGRVVF
ncbi:hypothetical protein [Mycobacterium branderi]|uniref:Pyrrolo-quinoline quinone n=1 Tax=Mycobacterium branderi TaxID=43348 RepID=A0ABM7KVP2_9MYCO|nr:hypothetical protein [Mycobacterium branderi]MCV7236268.1 hypothetical protein [Mycobacterium branderi]BBZ15149.1 hypothetical protein MBRA_53440 [Mycobacterium branderi]